LAQRSIWWMSFLLAVLIFLPLACSSQNSGNVELVNVSYDPTHELYRHINERFIQACEKETGEKIEVKQSNGGSAKQEVFEHPANAFGMDFLGNMNVFHARVHDGRAMLGGVEVNWPQVPQVEGGTAPIYVRLHELDIDHSPNGSRLQATVLHVNPAGPIVRIQ
jgi:ABC-type sulfate/molybdate transport systems ATPase subunit